MKYYSIAEIDITDRSWVQEYVQTVTKQVEHYGGRYLSRTAKIERLEGERKPAQIVVLVEWPTREAALAFYESEEYRPFRERRIAGARNEFLLVAGEDMTGASGQ
ncbi:MAG TPA: DUF1330 domain-containing protein [Thermoanaerobaculia bacterium]|nr:DUF1330 domain-containing protein [Thermoanaerobaculia bacterium]